MEEDVIVLFRDLCITCCIFLKFPDVMIMYVIVQAMFLCLTYD